MTESEFNIRILPLHRKLYACAFAILKNESDAADCIQDVFTRLWENRSKLLDIDNPAAYALASVRNTALNMISRQPADRVSNLECVSDIPDSSPLPSANLENDEAVRLVKTLLGSLSDNQREVMQLSALAGLSNSEISVATGLSGENVRVLISRARKKLKSFFSSKYLCL